MSQDYFDQAEFADNPEPRCPVALVLDVSGSMSGKPVEELNSALQSFEKDLKEDPLASLRVEVAIITFGGKVKVVDVRGTEESGIDDAGKAFVTVDGFTAPKLKAHGSTPVGKALEKALQLLLARKQIYKETSTDYFRPWLFLITDGKPTDSWQAAADQLKMEEARGGVSFFSIGVEGADMEKLAKFSDVRPPLKLKGLAFNELFEWLSKSLSAVAQSKVGDQVPLPPVGWAEIDTGS